MDRRRYECSVRHGRSWQGLVAVTLLWSLAGVIAHAAPGDLDPAFGSAGLVTTGFPGIALAMTVQSNDKLILCGNVDGNLVLGRLLPNGTLDDTFGGSGSGLVVKDFPLTFTPTGVAVGTDGGVAARIAVVGIYGSPSALSVAMFDGAGMFLWQKGTDFGLLGQGGVEGNHPSASGEGAAINIDSMGRVVAVGRRTSPSSEMGAVVRITPQGDLDSSFDGNGIRLADFESGDDAYHAVHVMADGRILAAGTSNNDGQNSRSFVVARYAQNGAYDPTFGDGDGWIKTLILSNTSYRAFGLTLDAADRILAVGYPETGVGAGAIVRYLADGSGVDTTFDGDGIVTTAANDVRLRSVIARSDGTIIVAGTAANGSDANDFTAIRFGPDGTLDTSFGQAGIVLTDLAGGSVDVAHAAGLQSDGRLILAGGSGAGVGLAGYVTDAPTCGDGVVGAGEDCDDAGNVSGDGCSAGCALEPGWACGGAPSSCAPVCGDGLMRGNEECDDGSIIGGDGCSASCSVESGCSCTGEPSGCSCGQLPICSGGVSILNPKVVLTKLGGVAGDDKVKLTGALLFGPGNPPMLNPATQGAQLLLEDLGNGESRVISFTHQDDPIPPGGQGSGCDLVRDGWSIVAGGKSFAYKNRSNAIDPPACTPASANGLTQLKIKDKRTQIGQVQFKARMTRSSIVVPTGPLRLTIVLGASASQSQAGECGSHAFAAEECRFNASGTSLLCR